MEIETVHKGPGIDYTKGLITRAEDDAEVVQRTAHYNLMFNRLMYNADDNADNARLMISNKETGAVVADINLPSMLSQGRMVLRDIQLRASGISRP